MANPANTVDSLVLDPDKVRAGSQTGVDGHAKVGDSVIYDDAARMPDGTKVAVRVTVTEMSNADLEVDLTNGVANQVILLNDNKNSAMAGETVSLSFDFINQDTGEALELNGTATFSDIDKNGNTREQVILDAHDFVAYSLAQDTSLTAEQGPLGLVATGSEGNNPNDQDAWFQAEFVARSQINVTLRSPDVGAGYGFNGQDIANAVRAAIVAPEADPVITTAAGEDAGRVIEAGADGPGVAVATGTLSAEDANVGATLTWSGDAEGTYGALAIDPDTGVWTYTLNNDLAETEALTDGQEVTETFTLTVTDNTGATARQTVTVTIEGSNDGPRLALPAAADTLYVSGQHNAWDPLFETAGVWNTPNGHVGAAVAGMEFTRTFNVPEDGEYTIEFAADNTGTVSIDGAEVLRLDVPNHAAFNDVTTTSVTLAEGAHTIAVTGHNAGGPAGIAVRVVDAAGEVIWTPHDALTGTDPIAVQEDGDAASLELSAFGSDADADDDGESLTYEVTGQPAEGRASIDGSALSFDPGADFQDLAEGETRQVEIEVTATDSHGASATDTVSVTVTGENDLPEFDAAPATGAFTENGAPGVAGQFTVEQYLGYQTANHAALKAYAEANDASATAQYDVIDFSDYNGQHNGQFAGSAGWPASGGDLNMQSAVNNQFFARITTDFVAEAQDTYTFRTLNDDGVYLLIDGELLMSDNSYHGANHREVSVDLAPGPHSFELFFFEGGGAAILELSVRNSTGDFVLMGTPGAGITLEAPDAPATSGTIGFSDVDLSDTHTIADVAADLGTLGAMTAEVTTDTTGTGTGGQVAWEYTVDPAAIEHLAEGEEKIERFTLVLSDDKGGRVEKVVEVTLTGTNDAPVITSAAGADEGTVAEAGHTDDGAPVAGTPVASGTLAATDVDNGDTAIWSGGASGTYGSFAIDPDTGVWTYTLDNDLPATEALAEGQQVTETFTATVTDSAGATAEQQVTITVNGANDAPVITTLPAQNQGSVTEEGTARNGDPVAGNAVTGGTVTSSDVDTGATATWSGSAAGTYGRLVIDPDTGAWTYTLDDSLATTQALSGGHYAYDSFVVTVTDDKGAVAHEQINVRVNGADDLDGQSGVMLTEDVWLATDPEPVHLWDDVNGVSTEWAYHGGSGKLQLDVDLTIEAIFGEDDPRVFEDVDVSAYLQIFADLGFELDRVDIRVNDGDISLKFVARDVEMTEAEFADLPDRVDTPVTVRDAYGVVARVMIDVETGKSELHSPIALDLNGDGRIGVTGPSSARERMDGDIGETVFFDLDADGTLERIEWLSGDGDGFLVDNRDGLAAAEMDGTRLFGDQTGAYAHGYEKLSEWDGNADGTLTGAELDGLQIWVDDGDALVEAGELESLLEHGVLSISVSDRTVFNSEDEALIQSQALVQTDAFVGTQAPDFVYGDGMQVAFAPTEAGQVFRLYQAALGRAPDGEGHAEWSRLLLEGDSSLTEVAEAFVESKEFRHVYGKTDDADFVETLYQNVLGRDAAPGEIDPWVAQLSSGTLRADVLLGFSESREFITATAAESAQFAQDHTAMTWSDDVYRLFRATLDREPDLRGFEDWIEELAEGMSFLDAVSGFVQSREFERAYGDDLNNADFVTLLYDNVLDRAPDQAGLDAWTTQMEGGMSRAEVVAGFSQSPEFVNATTDDLESWMRAQGTDDVLRGGGGHNTLFGGQMSDTFIFNANREGTHRVMDLEAWDTLDFRNFGYADDADVLARMTQVGADTVFEDQGTTVLLVGVDLASISDEMIL